MRKLFILFFLIAISVSCFSQVKTSPRKRAKAERKFINLQYMDAIELYNELYKEGNTDSLVIKRLAISYHKIGEYNQAAMWYQILCADITKVTPSDIYNYSLLLKEITLYKESDSLMNVYANSIKGQNIDVKLANSFSKIREILNIERGSITNASFNTPNSDFGAVEYSEGLAFSSSRVYEEFNQKTYGWKNQPFLDIYYVKEAFGTVILTPFSTELNSKYHEGPISFTADQKQIFFTRNSPKYGKRDANKQVTSNLNIFHADLVDNIWVNIKSLPINNNKYSCGQASISKDGKRLFFVSNMPGGYGGTDIYYVDSTSTGWTEPVNVGNIINTKDNEMFPFIDKKGRLFFSSNGHIGLGGLDVFVAFSKNNIFNRIENLGVPINSSKDDFGFYLKDDEQGGFISSNRIGGKGDDDVYILKFSEPIIFNQLLVIRVFNKETKKLIELPNIELQTTKTTIDTLPANGILCYETIPGDKYNVSICKYGYSEIIDEFDFPKSLRDTLFKDYYLSRSEIGKINELQKIYYDYNKSNIRPDAARELNRVIKLLKENPEIRIELRSHTDCKANHKYNKDLSNRRSQSAVDYIVSRGINRNRIVAKSYGETLPVNQCKDGVKCTEKEHQQNRRTEINIIKI